VSSLEVVARSAPDGETETLALVDAGRGGAYAGRFLRREGILEMSGEARRVDLSSMAFVAPPPVTLDALDLPGIRPGDPVRALAAAIPAALARSPLGLAGLAATYLD
jgi:hypothetical protein